MRGHSASEDARERAYDPRIHLLCKKSYEDGWIAGSSPAMTALSQGNDLRAGAFRDAVGAPRPFAPAAPETGLPGALRQLFALSEASPDLKASQNFQQLQAQLSDIENKIAAARRFFNNAVQEYNTGIQQFPAVLLAGALGFAPKDFFDVGVEERKVLDQAPQVKF